MQQIINPFYVYGISFLFTLFVYELGWSEFYPELSIDLVIFIISTIIISFLLGKILDFKVSKKEIMVIKFSKIVKCTLFIYLGFFIEFIVNGGVPLFLILSQSGFVYVDFGIPVFHVFLLTFATFYSLLVFQNYIIIKERRYLIIFFLLIFINILIFNRGNFVFTIMAIMVIFLRNQDSIKKITIIKFITGIIIGLFCFGLMGNYRSMTYSSNIDYKNASEMILDLGQATSGFRDSFVPNEYFWSYIYISSSLANLQYTTDVYINANSDENLDFEEIKNMIIIQFIPDFLSKRIIDFMGYMPKPACLIIDNFTLVTMYGRSYMYAGYIGLILTFFYLILFLSIICMLLKKSDSYNVVIAILTVVCAFAPFTNMLVFSGWIFQLVYIILLENKIIRKYIM